MERSELRALVKDVEAALVEVGKKHTVQIKTGAGSYDRGLGGGGCVKLLFSPIVDGRAVDPAEKVFTTHCEMYGLSKDDLHREITLRREVFRITGLNMRASKNPILLTRVSDDAKFSCPKKVALRALGRAEDD